MLEIIDLSQEIFAGMPVYPGLPQVKITMHVSHEEWEGIAGSQVVSPAVNRLEMGEHTGTHVDAINHMGRAYREQSIGRFRFIGLPLKIRGGTGSPVRAVAIFEG